MGFGNGVPRSRYEERPEVPRERGVLKLRGEVALEVGARDRRPVVGEIASEGEDDPLRVDTTRREREPKVKEVAAFLPLVERAELRRQELVDRVGDEPFRP